MPQMIAGQILGFAATAATILSYQANTQKKLMLGQCLATVFTCISYLLLGADSGFVLNIVCLVRNVSFAILKPGSLPIRIATPILSLAMIVFRIFCWQGPISLLIMLGLAINTFFLSLGKPQVLRYSILLTCTRILIYNVAVFSMGGILNEGFAIISSLIGILRYRKKKETVG
jgi:hypothetical protein